MIDGKVRARVLNVEDGVVTLGIYAQGVWQRIRARTTLDLVPGAWIEGHLIVPPDDSMVCFKMLEAGSNRGSTSKGIDYEA